ncbi:sigma 54 modulation/S30EA ribosomal C-terminal domain-containing protein [Yinghuangia sp. YIM S10712]|uniref:sigma 54 modulation/S30EA ribosomal C-terminal domain-containing protein n=1 Tax=Yinghuangia sp. YIM S10712 TaxID=3436930 RepID=UPI003F52DC5C
MGVNITVRVAGSAQDIAAGARARIVSAVEAAVDGTNAVVEAVRVRLTGLPPGAAVLAQVAAEVNGRRVRVQRIAAGAGAAVDRLAEGMRERVAEATAPWKPRSWPRPDTGPGSAVPPAAPLGEAAIVRVKSPELVWCSPDAAARTMDAMDYDVHLFTDPATETDAAVFRVGPTGYRLARTVDAPPPHDKRGVPLTLSARAAERLTDAQALARAVAAELPYLFYADPEYGRGRVLYRRFSGGFGLIQGA